MHQHPSYIVYPVIIPVVILETCNASCPSDTNKIGQTYCFGKPLIVRAVLKAVENCTAQHVSCCSIKRGTFGAKII